MKRKALPSLVALSLLAMIFHRLGASSKSEDDSFAAGAHEISKSARVAKTPKSTSAQVDLPATVETESDFSHRRETIEPILQVDAAAELPALGDSLVRDSGAGLAELRQVIRRHAQTNGPAAAAWASQLPPSLNHTDVLTQIALGWATSDLSGALDWANALPEGKSRQAVIEQLGYEAARTNAAKALELAVSLEPGRPRDDLLEHAIGQWATTDFDAAVQWAEAAVSDEALRQRLLATVAVAVAGQHGAAAATLAATALTPGDEQDRVALAIVQRWVQHEPEQAAAWVAQFPDTPARVTTVQNLVGFWVAQDREAAANWLQALPEGTLRDAGVAAYTQVTAATEFAATE